MSTGHGFTHLWQTVQWSATSPNSSKCLSEMPRRVCSSYRNASISSDVAEDLVARAVEQVGARRVRRAHRLALAAAQAVLDHRRDVADLRLLEDQRLGAEQAERRRVRVVQRALLRIHRALSAVAQQLALVEAAFADRRAACIRANGASSSSVRNSSLVMPMPCSPEITPPSDAREPHDARDRLVRLLQHLVVVGVDRDVGVHVAVARVHVQRDEHAAAQHLAWISLMRASSGANGRPAKIHSSGARSSVFHDTRSSYVCSWRKSVSSSSRIELSFGSRAHSGRFASSARCQPSQRARTSATSARASLDLLAEQLRRRPMPLVRILREPPIASPARRTRAAVGAARSCCDSESSMLMRSMPSV